MNILKDLPELIDSDIISEETAARIRAYYQQKEGRPSSKLFIVFGILGSILVGLGIILIIAHNWDNLSRLTKTIFAFLPLVVGQIFCGYVLMRKRDNISWRESTAVFLFFAVGASISLVSQIYNIPGNVSSFLLTWSLLCLPLVYLLESSLVSLLYLVGITYYAVETNYWSNDESHIFWLLLLLIFPHCHNLYKRNPESNFMSFHHWLVPTSVVIVLGTVAGRVPELMLVAYFSLFGLLYLVGNLPFFSGLKLRSNGYRVIGSLGTVVLLLALSFDGFWKNLIDKEMSTWMLLSREFLTSALLTLLASTLLYKQQKGMQLSEIKPASTIFLLFALTFVVGMYSPIAIVLINIYILALGILIVREGARMDHLGVLNYGLLVITALVICRFFDTNLSFILRGILFVAVGVGFFMTNYWMLKKRKTDE